MNTRTETTTPIGHCVGPFEGRKLTVLREGVGTVECDMVHVIEGVAYCYDIPAGSPTGILKRVLRLWIDITVEGRD